MNTNSNLLILADFISSAPATSNPASNEVAMLSISSTSADRQTVAQMGQGDSSRRLTPYAAERSGPNTPSNPDQTRYIAPASFLTQVPGSNRGSLDEVIATYMTGRETSPTGSSETFELVRVLSAAETGPMSHTKSSAGPDLDRAVADYRRSADDAAGLSLAVSLTQSFNSSVKRLTQGQ